MLTGPRLRQVALVAGELGPVAGQLRQALGLGEPFHDPGVGQFGLTNAVFAVGDTFLEVVAPAAPGTAAGRYLERRGGDGGYMAIFQVPDLAAARRRLAGLGVRVVWTADLPDIAGTHLHPGDVPGAIVSLDWAEPEQSWRWAGPAWTGRAPGHVPGGVTGLTIEVTDPPAAARRWAAVLGLPDPGGGRAAVVELPDSGQRLRFVPAPPGRGEGITAVTIAGLPGGPRVIGGVRFAAGKDDMSEGHDMSKLDTGTEDLRAEIDGGVAVITMNRPDRRNAFSQAMISALGAVLAQVEADEAVGCVVLTGAGGAFCAGGDVKSMAAPPADGSGRSLDAAIHRQRLNQRATSGRLWTMPKPTIAAIGGPAAGAGLSLALACDLRYAVPGAVLTTAFARVAFSGDYGGTWFLTRLVGSGKAKELYYFSERLSAEQAQQLGIVNAIFPAADFEQEVMARARRLAAGPSIAYRYMKENLNRAVTGELGECMDLEVTHHVHTGLTEDHHEAARAFVDKREPRFRGR